MSFCSASMAVALAAVRGCALCRARCLGEATTGPANLRLGVEQSFNAVLDATAQVIHQAGLPSSQLRRIAACLALAGASEPTSLAEAQAHAHPFRKASSPQTPTPPASALTADATAASLSAGTGTIGWAIVKGRSFRVGGWGIRFLTKEVALGSAVRRCGASYGHLTAELRGPGYCAPLPSDLATIHMRSCDGRNCFTARLCCIGACVFVHAEQSDTTAAELLTLAAGHIDALAQRLLDAGATRLALVGGCAPSLGRGFVKKPGHIS